jgi:hypothetical protein
LKKLHALTAVALLFAGALAACSNDDDPAQPGDTTAPSRVTDLAIISAGDSTLSMQWTTPGDDGHSGKAKSYQIRWSDAPITESNFGSATAVPNPPTPATAGTVAQFAVTGVDTMTHIALRARDDAGNYSAVSNDAVWTPPPAPQHLSKNIPPFKDNTMYQEADTLSNAVGPYIYTGKTVGGGGTESRRALLAFAVADSIPAGAVIDSVILSMHLSKRRDNTSRATSLYRLTADWGEGTSDAGDPGGIGIGATTGDATWVYRFFNTTTWTTPGGDFVAGASATTDVTTLGSYTWKSAQMNTDVQAWLDTPANNFGWIVIGVESTLGTAKRFDSRENPTVANRPVLQVFYTVP